MPKWINNLVWLFSIFLSKLSKALIFKTIADKTHWGLLNNSVRVMRGPFNGEVWSVQTTSNQLQAWLFRGKCQKEQEKQYQFLIRLKSRFPQLLYNTKRNCCPKHLDLFSHLYKVRITLTVGHGGNWELYITSTCSVNGSYLYLLFNIVIWYL